MIIKEIKGLDTKVYYEKLNNGLQVFLIPYENRNRYFIEYGVKYGAEINQFVSIKSNKKIKVPYGIAHFLEHKMFEQENGKDPFSFYSESGSDANAATGYQMTSYTVEGTDNLLPNLDFLLDYVNSPYFTKENVEKEKGIIIEELNMYKDQPENVLSLASNRAVFKKHPMRIDIGGTPKSVRKITKEVLYDCYETFYSPNNMFLVITGKLNPEDVMNIVRNNKKLNDKKANNNLKIYKPVEPLEVNKKERKIKIKNLVIPKFILNIKSKLKEMDTEEKYKYLTSIDILLYILFGPSSEFREEMLKKDYYTFFYSSESIVDDLLLVEFVAETKHPDELKEEIINYFKTKKITKEDVERVKKVKLSIDIMGSDSPERMMSTIIDHYMDFGEIVYNKIDLIKSITYEDVLQNSKDILIDNYSIVTGYKK